MADYKKGRRGAPNGFFDAEAAGLRWLAEPRVIPVVEVHSVESDGLTLQRLSSVRPTARAAQQFGADLARLHDAGAPAFGFTPAPHAWFGPLESPFPISTEQRDDFATFFAEDRLRPLAERAAQTLGAQGAAAVDRAIEAIAGGTFSGISGSGTERPSRLHGDLWSGNVMWTPEGGTLIDPAAHGGHRLEDLAMLGLFSAPYLDEIYAAYEAQHPMPADWRDDLPAHVMHGILAHVVLFGASYAAGAVSSAQQVAERAAELG